MNFQLASMAIAMPAVHGHPNREPFRGVLTLVDTPSDKPPAGSRGHRVILTRTAAERALPSLLGMALDFSPSFDRHDARCKVGVITRAEIAGKELELSGYLFAKDFPEIVQQIESGIIHASGSARSRPQNPLGMSYEIADASVADVRAKIWTLTHVTFTGAAILRRDKAAYRDTWIELE
ncbi:MAG: hypothetical protein JWN74_2236 [Acidobacteriaceae bacterium]|nr:hypothetical protein [Acidobacteriaceae bacterium]